MNMFIDRKMTSRILLLLGIVILLYFFSTIDAKSVYSSLRSINVFLFSIAIVLTILNILLKGYRWKLIVKHLTGVNISMNLASISILAGVAVGSLIPGRCDVAKPLMLKRIYNVSLNRTMAGMFMERILDVLALFLLFFVSAILFLNDYSSGLSAVEFVVFFLLIISIPVFFPGNCIFIFESFVGKIPKNSSLKENLVKSFSSFIESFSILRDKDGLWFAFLSLTAMFIETLRLYCVFTSLNIRLSLDLSIFSFCSSIIIGLMSMIPGGLGTTEFSQTEILKQYIFVSPDILKSAVILDRFLSYYLLILIGSIVLLTYHRFYKINKVEET